MLSVSNESSGLFKYIAYVMSLKHAVKLDKSRLKYDLLSVICCLIYCVVEVSELI